MKIYVASSWRNQAQPEVIEALREAGHEVYDFRDPHGSGRPFAWREIDPDWQQWEPATWRAKLEHPIAVAGFHQDMAALAGADCCVLVLPSGRSAHLEAGWAKGTGKLLFVLLAPGEPDLMTKMADYLALSIPELVTALAAAEEPFSGEHPLLPLQ